MNAVTSENILAMYKSSQVISTARTLINTPYQHQGRKPGVGIDCIGLVIVTAHQLGLFDYDYINYSRDPDGQLLKIVEKHCEKLPDLTEGAIAVFQLSAIPHHVGIISKFRGNWGLIHAYQNTGKVREHEFIKWWQNKLVGIYALPNVQY